MDVAVGQSETQIEVRHLLSSIISRFEKYFAGVVAAAVLVKFRFFFFFPYNHLC